QAKQHASDPNHFTPGTHPTVELQRKAPTVLRQTLAVKPRAEQATNGLHREVFGFLPYWELNSSLKLNYGTLSTIGYFSVPVDRNGNLIKKNSDGSTATGWGGWTSSNLTSVINLAHQQGIRVVLTLTMFAWSSSDASTQGSFLGNATARVNLAQQAAQAVADRGADGEIGRASCRERGEVEGGAGAGETGGRGQRRGDGGEY